MQKHAPGLQEKFYNKIKNMKDFIIKYYGRMRDYLLEAKAEGADIESIAFEVGKLEEEYFNEMDENISSTDSEYEEQNAVWGLFRKFDRLYGENSNFVERDAKSLLAMKIDLGFGIYTPPCPYSEEDYPDIQKKITTFISQRVKTPEDEDSKPLLSGIPQTQLPQQEIQVIVENLTSISHSIKNYVEYYDDGQWNWETDLPFISQYVFEKAAELTYAIIHGDNIETLSYDIKDAFSYFQISVPTQFQMRLDGVVGKLNDVVLDIISFINKKDYDLCNKETWLRPILFNLALDGMLYTLEKYSI